MTALNLNEYKSLSKSLAKKKFHVDKSKNAIKGITSSGHLIVRDTTGIVELVPPTYFLNTSKDLGDTENVRSEYKRLLLLYIAEITETRQITSLQALRIQELFEKFQASSASWKELNDSLQKRLTTSIDSISDLKSRYEDLTRQLQKEKTTRTEALARDTTGYSKSTTRFHRLNKSALQLARQLDAESQKLTDDQVLMVEPPLMKRDGVDIRDIRVNIS